MIFATATYWFDMDQSKSETILHLTGFVQTGDYPEYFAKPFHLPRLTLFHIRLPWQAEFTELYQTSR